MTIELKQLTTRLVKRSQVKIFFLGLVWHFSKSKWKQCNNTHLILQIFRMSPKTHWYCFQTTEVLFNSHPLFFDSTVCLRRLYRCRMNSWYNSRGPNVLWTFEISPKTHWEIHCVLGNFKFKYINVSKTHWECQCVFWNI